METKEQLVNCIKQWVKIDNEIRTLQNEQVKRKKEKKTISKDLIEVMKKNQIDCFDIKDGQLVYNKKNVKKPITKKELLQILSTYYEGDTLKANEVTTFIDENRKEVVKETITRKVYKIDTSEDE
jgi:hypothetical protein